MPPRCSIIIRCYNEAKSLGKLLSGISQQEHPLNGIEVVAVDSGSTDSSPQILKEHRVKTLFLDPNEFSFGRSCNIGCEAASGEFLVFISAHAFPVYRNWLETLLKPFEDENVALSYGKQRGNGLNSYSERQIFKTWYPESEQKQLATPFCNNANSAIRRCIWERIRFDENLTGLEDIDFAKRAIQMGYTIAYAAAAEITHVHEEQPSVVFNRYRREAIAYRQIFPDENITLLDFVQLYTVNVASDCYHALFDGELKSQFTNILLFRLMQFWGAYKGMRQTREVSGELKQRLYYPAGLQRYAHDGNSELQHRAVHYSE